jgi:hypothetical protein
MGLLSSGPSDRFTKKEIAKDLKHLKLNHQQQNDFMEKLEEVRKKHGTVNYKIDHIHEAARHLSSTSGDSLQSSHINRIRGHFSEKHETRVNPPTEIKEKAKVTDMREYKNLRQESLETPPKESTAEPEESLNDRFDKAA